MGWWLWLCIWLGGQGLARAQEVRTLREPVHPRRNVEDFPAVETKALRFTILKTSGQEPCLDELEVYGPDDPVKNLALASLGTQARASGTYPAYRIHALPHVNDGLYGNGHSWISSTPGGGWVELDFPAAVKISRVVWSRDRERKFIDRLATEYRVEILETGTGQWREVASSTDRRPLPEEAGVPGGGFAWSVPWHFAAVATAAPPPGNDRPAAREYLLRTWQTADGLPSNTVTALLQTRDGWLWVGTTNGPARFDGRRFTAFGEGHGLGNLAVTCLLEDREGTLWAGTEGGGLAFWKGGKFQALSTGSSLAGNTVLAMAEDSGGALWAATAEGLLEVSNGAPRAVLSGPVTGLAAGEGGLWLLRNSLLACWNGKALVTAPMDLDPSCFSSISAVSGGQDGAVWFGGANGYVGRLAGGAVTTFGEGHTVLTSNIWRLLAAADGDVWIGSSATGLARLRGHDVLQLTTDDGLPGNCVRAVCQDAEGNVWVGTAGGGLTRLKPRKIQTLSTRDGLSHNAITALAEDAGGAVWIGTDGGGLNCWRDGKAEPRTPSYVLDNQTVSSLAWAEDGALWLGTSGSGAFRLPRNADGGDGPLEHFGESQGLPGRLVSALCPDTAGRLWLGTLDGGPVCLDGGKAARRLPELEALTGQPVTAVLEDPEGGLWFGTNGQGAARLDRVSNALTRWGGPAQGLSSSFIRTLRLDSRGAVWAGTNGGLTRWRKGKIFSFTPRHGLTNAVVSQILDGGDGHLWLGTNAGVMRIPLDSLDAVEEGRAGELEVLTLGTNDGLPSLECTGGSQPAGLRLRDGRLCFGTVAGLAVIRPDDFAPGKTAPPVVIESCAIGGAAPAVNPGIVTGPPGRKWEAPPDTQRLGFEFTALSPGSPDRVRFRYRLAGLERSWVEVKAGAERAAVYTHPGPGDYVFEVLASADGGPWSGVPARLAVRVLAPWWREPWAVAAGGLLAAGMVAGLARTATRRRMQRRVRELERQFALERERSRIARDIHDDLGASLTRISLLSAVGRDRCQDPDRARDQFAAIGRTSGELVQAMDAIVWAVNPAQDTLESLARYLVRFAGDLFAHSGVKLRLDVPADLPRAVLPSEIRHNLFLAAKEALNNALNHAQATEVRLSLRAGPAATTSAAAAATANPAAGLPAVRHPARTGTLTVEIQDNGHGFTELPEPEGNGLINMRHRLTECGGSCGMDSTPGQGTLIRLSLPISFTPSSS